MTTPDDSTVQAHRNRASFCEELGAIMSGPTAQVIFYGISLIVGFFGIWYSLENGIVIIGLILASEIFVISVGAGIAIERHRMRSRLIEELGKRR